MPYIKINETEATSYVTFDVTENTVLIPMLYVRKIIKSGDEYVYSETTVPSAKLYTDVTTLVSDWGKGGGYDGSFARYVQLKLSDTKNILDRSYIMAYELILKGLKVVIKPILFDNKTYLFDSTKLLEQKPMPVDDYIYELQQTISPTDTSKTSVFEEFKDRNNFNIKFITTGGYPNYGEIIKSESDTSYNSSTMYAKIVEVAEARADAIALVEFKSDLLSSSDIITEAKKIANPGDEYKYAAAFTPWASYSTSVSTTVTQCDMPGCFGYLMAYANSVKTNANWFAAAGVTRGYIPNMIEPLVDIGESVMHILQGDPEASETIEIKVNPIYNAGTYGYRIWGNRVMKATGSVNNDKYQDFLNVRMLVCDIKKQVFHAAMRTTFEPNDDIVWINFKTLANSLLDKMKSGRGLSWYNWVKKKSSNKGVITAVLSIRPIEAVDSFDITIKLTDEEASIEEA